MRKVHKSLLFTLFFIPHYFLLVWHDFVGATYVYSSPEQQLQASALQQVLWYQLRFT